MVIEINRQISEEGTTTMGRRAYEKLARICASLNTSEQELAHSLGISRVALKAIDRTDAPLYLRLALAALVSEMNPELVQSIFMKPFNTIQEAYDNAVGELGNDSKVLVMPYGGSTLPILNSN